MTNMTSIKRMAAELLKVGETRVWIDPDATSEVMSAMTRGDIKKYIGLGFIGVKPKKGNSRGRFRKNTEQRKKGRRRGYGNRKGKKTARENPKQVWIKKIRSQRKLLKELRDSNKISSELYRKTYRVAKAGTFKSKAQLKSYLIEKSKQEESK